MLVFQILAARHSQHGRDGWMAWLESIASGE